LPAVFFIEVILQMQKILLLATLLIILSCNSGKEKEVQQERKEKQEEVFPIALFFHEQIRMVDSLKLPTVKVTVTNGKTTTEAISMEEFKSLAQEFINADISDPSLKNVYRESSFADQSIPSITLTYSTLDSSREIQRLDVIIDPDPVREDRVKTIYIEKGHRQGDTAVQKKLYWKANENFQVLTSKNLRGKKPVVNQVKVSWNGMN
jgi:hypothetical protein